MKYHLVHSTSITEPFEGQFDIRLSPFHGSFHVFKHTSKSYMWLYRTSGCAKQAIVLYEYQPTRKAEHAEAFLQGFSGWLHADGYQGYLYFDVLPWLNLFLRFCDDWR